MRRVAIVLMALGVLLASCSAGARDEWRNGPAPTCDTTSRGRLILMAQSVPEATLIPCIGPLPVGWEFLAASSRTSESVLRFSNDAFDVGVDVVLTGSCPASDSGPIDSRRAGTRLFVDDEGKEYSFAFEGGCIRFDFDDRSLAESSQGRALMDAVPFMSRDRLRELSGWTL